MADTSPQIALGDNAARQLANATKTVPQLSIISPRWLTHLCNGVPVEAGIYRGNQVKNPESIKVTCTSREEENQLPRTFVDYDENPREHFLNAVSTLQGYTTEEVGKALNEEGIAVRTGHHCAQPILRRFCVDNCAAIIGVLQRL